MLTLEQLEDFKSKTEAFKLLKSSAHGALSQATKSLISIFNIYLFKPSDISSLGLVLQSAPLGSLGPSQKSFEDKDPRTSGYRISP